MTHGLNHINIRAERALVDACRAFYCDVLGLTDGFRPPFPGYGYWLYCDGVTDKAAVHLYEAEPGEDQKTDVRTTLDHFAFDCTRRTDVEAALAQHGVDYRRSVIPLTGQVQLFLKDPAGNTVELNFANADV